MFRLLSFFILFTSVFINGSNIFKIDTPVSLVQELDHWKQFSIFQERFSKKYESILEFKSRFEVFSSNLKYILEHNSDSTQNFTLGMNQFSDLTNDEFKEKYVSGLKNGVSVGSYGCKSFSSSGSAPDTIDWRTLNKVSSVKDQGQCGSCWAFSSTGAIESAWAISKNQLIDLSEQELVDCATGILYGSHGCNGGQMEGGFKYVIGNGQCLNSAYPYTSGLTKSAGSCQKCSSSVQISGCYDVVPNDQLSLKVAVSKQPVAIAIEADTTYFQSYSSGILDSVKCGTTLDHGVLIVGYGEENGQKYWIVKNSWSETWGDKGYVRIARSESANDAGICGIGMNPSFPVV